MLVCEPIAELDKAPGAQHVDVGQRPAGPRRKAPAENCSDIGVSGVGWLRFLILNLIAAFIWAVTFISAGYLSGRAMHRALGQYAQQFSVAMLVGLAVILLAAYLYQRLRRRRAEKAASVAPPDVPKLDA